MTQLCQTFFRPLPAPQTSVFHVHFYIGLFRIHIQIPPQSLALLQAEMFSISFRSDPEAKCANQC